MEKLNNKQKYVFITYLKVIAAILIVNSHYDKIYPIQALATGGAIGNALFFAVSGFCLYPITQPFQKWIFPRLKKIYIPTIIMTVIAFCTYKSGEFLLHSFFSLFIWPTMYWFVGAIVIFYVLYYVLKDIEKNRSFIFLGLILSIIYVIYYIFFLDKTSWVIETKGLNSLASCFKLIYYFAAMMIGKWFRINIDLITHKKKQYGIGIIISFISLYGIKLLISKVPSLMWMQFLNQISVEFIIIFTFMFGISIEENLKTVSGQCLEICNNISKFTLHLYLVQFLVIECIYRIVFPVNFIIATVVILAGAILLYTLCDLIDKALSSVRQRRKVK